MAEKVRCEICDRTFKDVEGLAQHNAAKHNLTNIDNGKSGVKIKKITNWTIFIVIILGILGFIVWTVMGAISESSSCKTDSVTEINIGAHKNLKLHTHADLKIIIDNEEQFIPANIGVSPGIMRPLHTHDADGEIHMEGPCVRSFKLGEFFSVWGRKFNSKCIFDKCDDLGVLKTRVNGVENSEFENYVMNDGDNIVIEYKSLEILK